MGFFDSLTSSVSKQDKQDKLDEKYMKQALREAEKAYERNDVPIGCLIVRRMENDREKVIAKAYNRRNADGNVLSHAELIAISTACRKTGDWRLEDCTIYITLEPCQMCAGAIVQARIPRVVIGAMNPKAGCAGSIINLLDMAQFNHQAEVKTGVMKEECSSLMSDFFADLRDSKAEHDKFVNGQVDQAKSYMDSVSEEDAPTLYTGDVEEIPPERNAGPYTPYDSPDNDSYGSDQSTENPSISSAGDPFRVPVAESSALQTPGIEGSGQTALPGSPFPALPDGEYD